MSGEQALSILQQWQATPQPKVHFSPAQQFVPPIVYDLLQQRPELNPKPAAELGCFANIVGKVNQYYTLPFQPYDYQAAVINALGDKDAAGLWLEVGAGKTAVSAIMALYHRIDNPGHIMVVMPPILLTQWARFFRSIPEINRVLVYRGTPAERRAMNLDADVILLSMDIFKNDFERLYDFYLERNVTLIVDEAVSVKNTDTMNHKCVWAFHNKNLTRYHSTVKRKAETKLKKAGKSTGQNKGIEDIIAAKRKILEMMQ